MMPICHLTKRCGETIDDPQVSDLIDAIEEIRRTDPEHPDCWLSSEDGWSISVFEHGLVVMENVETGEGPWHVRSVQEQVALALWRFLLEGEIAALKTRAWVRGYGNEL